MLVIVLDILDIYLILGDVGFKGWEAALCSELVHADTCRWKVHFDCHLLSCGVHDDLVAKSAVPGNEWAYIPCHDWIRISVSAIPKAAACLRASRVCTAFGKRHLLSLMHPKMFWALQAEDIATSYTLIAG